MFGQPLNPREELELKELMGIIDASLDLSTRRRRLVWKHKVEEGMTSREVSEKYAVPIRTINCIYDQAKYRIRRYIEREFPEYIPTWKSKDKATPKVRKKKRKS